MGSATSAVDDAKDIPVLVQYKAWREPSRLDWITSVRPANTPLAPRTREALVPSSRGLSLRNLRASAALDQMKIARSSEFWRSVTSICDS
jgi:hypothetical protein